MWEHFNLIRQGLENRDAGVIKHSRVRDTFKQFQEMPHVWGIIEKETIFKFCVEFGVPKRGEQLGVWSPFRPSSSPKP